MAASFPPIPQGAVTFTLWQIWTEQDRRTGKSRGKSRLCKGEPSSDGSIPEAWPIEQFTARTILEVWGANRYKVEFWDVAGLKIGRRNFEIGLPPSQRVDAELPRVRKGVDPEAPAAAADPHRSMGGMSPMDVLMMIDARERAASERAREQAAADRSRDRDFFAQMFQLMTASQRPGQAQAIDTDLIRREMLLEMRTNMFELRRDLARQDDTDEPEDAEPEPGDPPANFEEAGERIGMRLLSELEQRAPQLINEAIPQIVSWLQAKGFVPSAALQREIQARGRMNGAGGANG